MAKRASDWIPHNILAAAQKAGLGLPMWYVGRSSGHDAQARKKQLKDITVQARQRGQQRAAARRRIGG